MKRFIITAILILPALIACTPDSEEGAQSALNVVLSKDKVDLQVGESVTITASVLPASLNMGVEWSVIDPEFATVENGTITGKAEGVTYVVATSKDRTQKAACLVSVNPPVNYSVSIKDEDGHNVTGLYGYPGLTAALTAVASDGETHIFTWSVEDASAAFVTNTGLVTLNAVASASSDYVYDAQTFLKVVTEDNQGCKIPVRSSILKGIRIGELYTPAGTPAIVQESQTYPIAALYQDASGTAAIPPSGVGMTLSNNTAFSLQEVAGEYMLVTGDVTGVSTKLRINLPGSAEKTEIAQIKIDKVYAITAQFAGSSSSTLTFTWTKGVSEDQDIANPYTIYLYRDEDCTDLEASFSIPAGDGCWKGKQPRFVFTGLTPGTEYWFKVVQTDDAANVYSPLIPATTEDFNIVMVSSDPAAVGDVILAEDFGQMCWGADEITEAAGYDVATSSVAYNTDTKESFTSRDAEVFVGTTSQYAQRSLTAQSVAKKESGFRLAKWAQGQYARIYIGPGYLFLSTKSYGTHIITPELNSIPDGMTAKLKVTVHAAGKSSGGEAAFAVQHGKSFNEISSGTQTNKNKLDLSTNVQTVTFNGGITSLEKFEVTLDGVVAGDRIAFGPTSESTQDNSNMMIISDMTVEILELN